MLGFTLQIRKTCNYVNRQLACCVSLYRLMKRCHDVKRLDLKPSLKVQSSSPTLHVPSEVVIISYFECFFKNIFCLKALAVSWVWGFCSMISNLIIDAGEPNICDMKLCWGLWKGNQGHKGPCLPHRRVYLATETVNFHTWIALLIRKSLRIKEPSSPKKENKKRLA